MSIRSRVALIAAVLVVTTVLVLAGRRGPFTRNGTLTGDDSVAITDTVIIDGETPTCSACTLEATRVAVLGTPRDPEIPQRVPSVLRDSRGMYYLVFNRWSDKPILRYDSTGKYLGKIGSYGNGPGEYTVTHTVFVGAGDSLFVFGRQFQLYAPDGRYQRVVRVPRGTPAGLIPGTERLLYAVTHPVPNALDANRRVLVIDGQGEVVDSFPVFTVDFFNTARPVVGPDGSLWTYMERNYRLERHAPDGSVKQLIGVIAPPERTRPIMTSIEADSLLSIAKMRRAARGGGRGNIPVAALPFGPSKGPRPHMAMMVDSTGLLWVLRNVAAPRWDTLTITPQHRSPNEAPGETTVPREQEDRMYQAIVEVIDPRRAQVIARTTLPFLGILASPGYVARVTTDDDGHYRTEVYRVALRRE
jgi:hypothetical protein